MCLKVVPELRQGIAPRREHLSPLLRFGSWVMLSQFLSQFALYADRFFIGHLVSMAAVGIYSLPCDLLSRIWIIPSGISAVLFPAFAQRLARNPEGATGLLERGIKLTFFMVFPVCLGVVIFAHDGLTAWMGPNFPAESATVAQWLTIGILMNSVANSPFTLLQGAHRPDLAATADLLETPVYLLALYLAVERWGVLGAAVVWSARFLLFAIILFALLPKVLSAPPIRAYLCATLMVLTAFVAMAGATVLPSVLWWRLGYFFAASALAAGAGWALVLSHAERAQVFYLVLRRNPAGFAEEASRATIEI
jgi:O-antigen/teichoic acid export membrane protein